MSGLIGQTLGHYRIVEKIGEGGMGEVYRAHDERLDRDVAIKVLHRDVAQNADRLARFEREAKAVAKLDHPNILAIHQLGTHEESPFIVTELLDGESLRKRIPPGGIARLVERCLQKEVSERFQSAVELKAAIEASLAPDADREQASIAVLPFVNMSGSEEDDYLCEGLAEEIINVLTRIPGLRVIARTSSFAIGRMELDVREAGARLDVDSILEGSVRRVGQRVRITAQLVTTGDGSHLWSERFDRELTDILVLEDEIAEAIAERLRVGLKQEDRGQRRPAVDPTAHALFLEGRYYVARGTPDAMAKAKGCFERVFELDPTFALAHDSLAELYWYLGFFGGVSPREAFSQGMWHALRALELDDTLAETHALLGMLRKVLEQTETMAAKAYVPPSTFALGHVGLEDWDAAFHWWDQAVEVRDPIVVPVKTFPFFDPVRGDPRYRAILRRMNLPED